MAAMFLYDRVSNVYITLCKRKKIKDQNFKEETFKENTISLISQKKNHRAKAIAI